MKDLQVENGNYTRIVNPLIEELIKIPFKGCELAVAMFIIRKTYGFQKKQDEISLTQFEKALQRTRPVVVKALKNLQLVKVLKLVKGGTSRNSSNLWEINKYYETWELVKVAKLVKHRRLTSKDKTIQLVYPPKHTKETIQKKIQKKGGRFTPPSLLSVKEYITQQGYEVDADNWYDFYESKGWMVGKNKMKSWQACIRTWQRRNKPTNLVNPDLYD